MKNNKEFMLTCIKENGLVLEFAKDDLKNDIEIVLYAMIQDKLPLKFASIELKNKIIEKLSIPRLQCRYCNKFYKSRKTNLFHIKSCKLDHPKIVIVNNRYICNICDRISNCLSSVYNHKKHVINNK